MMDTEDFAADAALFARLRMAWEEVDPVPADLVDRMVAAVAVEDLSREYALLTLVEGSVLGAVRGEADTATLAVQRWHDQRAPARERHRRGCTSCRMDGWMAQPSRSGSARVISDWSAEASEHGRFAFETIPAGVSYLRLVVRGAEGDLHEFQTPQFEM